MSGDSSQKTPDHTETSQTAGIRYCLTSSHTKRALPESCSQTDHNKEQKDKY